MPNFYLLVGVPASGKSYWRNTQTFNGVVISTDDIIERIAAEKGVTYSEAFTDAIKLAEKEVLVLAAKAFEEGKDVIWDQTNVTVKTRKKKLDMVPRYYTKIAVFFPTPGEELHKERLESRKGKTIPSFVLKNMIGNLEEPTLDEGFNKVIKI
jgi:predicted kinase